MGVPADLGAVPPQLDSVIAAKTFIVIRESGKARSISDPGFSGIFPSFSDKVREFEVFRFSGFSGVQPPEKLPGFGRLARLEENFPSFPDFPGVFLGFPEFSWFFGFKTSFEEC